MFDGKFIMWRLVDRFFVSFLCNVQADVHRLVAQFLQSHRSVFVASKLDFTHDAKLSKVLKYLVRE